jgi:hypothetical protein
MVKQFLDFLDQIGFELICLVIPGILFILGGIRILKTKRTISIGRDSNFHWKKPIVLKGEHATWAGKWILALGITLFFLGLIAIIGILE